MIKKDRRYKELGMKTTETVIYLRQKGVYSRVLLVGLTLAVALLLGCTTPRTSSGLKAPGLSESLDYTPPQPHRLTFPNGLKVLYLPDNELPLVKMNLHVRGGSNWEDARSSGTIELTGAMLRKGGAGQRTADQVDQRLRELAASVSSSISGEMGSISMECLDQDVDEVFGIFSDIMLRPRFQKDRLELLKRQSIEAVSRRKDDPWTIASISIDQLLYGDSFLGRPLTSYNIRKVQTGRMRQAYKEFLRPERSVLTVTGKISLDHLKELLDLELAYLKDSPQPLPDLVPVLPPEQPRIVYIESNLEQATVVMAQLGAPRYSPDHFPILVYNEAFSGGMSSLLTKKIRSDLGLAYSVYGGVLPGLIRGKNAIALQTKSQSTGSAIVESLKAIEETRTTPLSENLVAEKKRGMSASFVFAHSSPSAILSRLVSLDFLGYPDGYDAFYLDRLSKVKPQELQTLAQNRWHTGVMSIVIVGNRFALESFLAVKSKLPAAYATVAVEQGVFQESLELRPLIFTTTAGNF
jgi:zinc protease